MPRKTEPCAWTPAVTEALRIWVSFRAARAKRRVELAYFMDLGRGAYARLADDLSAALAELFAALSRTFDEIYFIDSFGN